MFMAVNSLFGKNIVPAVPASPYLAPAYANQYGTGERRNMGLTVSTDATKGTGGSNFPEAMFDGLATGLYWIVANQTNRQFTFTFPHAVKITEVTWKQGGAGNFGTWKWQGSNDGAAYADITAAFTLGADGTTVHDLGANTQRYLHYRLQQVSGNTITAFIQEIEFKLDQPDPYPVRSWLNPHGSGDRTNSYLTPSYVIVTASAGLTGATSFLVNGAQTTNVNYWANGLTAAWLKFDLGVGQAQRFYGGRTLDQFTNACGTWKWQGSNDDATWVDLTSPAPWSAAQNTWTADLGVTTPFRYFKLLQTAGTTTNDWFYEVLLDLGPPVIPAYGPELIINGDGNSTASWTPGGSVTVTSVGGRLRLTAGASVGSSGAVASQSAPMTVGNKYRFTATMWASEASKARIQSSQTGILSVTGNGPTFIDQNFVANFGVLDMTLGVASPGAWASPEAYAEFDNMSLKRIL